LWACNPQTAMLRYFLRVSPEYGVGELTAALTRRNTTHCYQAQLSAPGVCENAKGGKSGDCGTR
jgi:hypothetical protein